MGHTTSMPRTPGTDLKAIMAMFWPNVCELNTSAFVLLYFNYITDIATILAAILDFQIKLYD